MMWRFRSRLFSLAACAVFCSALACHAAEPVELKQANEVKADYWIPFIADLYVMQDSANTDNQGLPVYTDKIFLPPPHYTAINGPPLLVSDWSKVCQFLEQGDALSAWVTSDKFGVYAGTGIDAGRPRILIHDVRSDGLAGIGRDVRYMLNIRVDIAKDNFAYQGDGEEVRRAALRKGIRVLKTSAILSYYNDVRPSGLGGAKATDIEEQKLSFPTEPKFDTVMRQEFVCRGASTGRESKDEKAADKLDYVAVFDVSCTVEASPELFPPEDRPASPEQKTVTGQIRMYVQKRSITIDTLSLINTTKHK